MWVLSCITIPEAHQRTFKILRQAPDGIDVGDLDYDVGGGFAIGALAGSPGTSDNISLTWPVDEGGDWGDNRSRLCIYKTAFASVAYGIRRGLPAFYTMFCIRLRVTRFQSFVDLGIQNLPGVVFIRSDLLAFPYICDTETTIS